MAINLQKRNLDLSQLTNGNVQQLLDALSGVNTPSALDYADPRYLVGDPAAWASEYGHEMDQVAVRLDTRPSSELREVAFNHADPVMREQALFEYADRNETDAIDLLTAAAAKDSDRDVRWNTLWAIEKLGGMPAVKALQGFTQDSDPEIAEWSNLFISELKTGDPVFDKRPHNYLADRTFDETIYLLIHCDLYIRLDPSNKYWGKMTLSPQALARVFGQGHACPNVDNRDHTLVIAKIIDGLYPDGSPHVDNYLFKGFTERTRADRANFYFESNVRRHFFMSGKIGDPSEGVDETQIGFTRRGRWYLDHNFRVKNEAAIRYVRGRFHGWAYVNLARVIGKSLEEIIVPGNGVLSTLHDPVIGPMTNVFLAGTYKGKLNDWDNDGKIDLNSLSIYSTRSGDVDMDMDGVADVPGMTCVDTWKKFI